DRRLAVGHCARRASRRPSLLPKWYFTSAALTPDFCAMSDSETSIEARAIINSLAATSSFSAVGFFAGCVLAGMLVFNWGAIAAWVAMCGAHLSACRGRTQELIDRLTKTQAAP